MGAASPVAPARGRGRVRGKGRARARARARVPHLPHSRHRRSSEGLGGVLTAALPRLSGLAAAAALVGVLTAGVSRSHVSLSVLCALCR